jgi:hypothetical protein
VAALVAGATLSCPALGAPVYVDADTHLASDASVQATGSGCTHFIVPLPPTDKPVVENGGSVTVATSVTGSAAGPTAGDTASVSADATATASVSSANGLPRSMDFTISGQASLVTQQPVSACVVQGYAEATLHVHLVLATPGYLTAEAVNDGHSFAALDLENSDAGLGVSISSFGWKTERRLRLRVPAGSYLGTLDGSVGAAGRSSDSGQGTAQVHVTFTPYGALTSPAVGPGGRFVTLPTTSSCSTSTLDATITPKRKRAAKIARLRFFLGDHLVLKVRHPKRGAVVRVPLDPTMPSPLRAEITFAPTGHHKKKPPVDVAAGYEACS